MPAADLAGLQWLCSRFSPSDLCARAALPVRMRERPCGWSERDFEGSGMDRAEKSQLVSELKQTFTETSVVVVTRNLGLTVAQSTALRIKMRDAGASYK